MLTAYLCMAVAYQSLSCHSMDSCHLDNFYRKLYLNKLTLYALTRMHGKTNNKKHTCRHTRIRGITISTTLLKKTSYATRTYGQSRLLRPLATFSVRLFSRKCFLFDYLTWHCFYSQTDKLKIMIQARLLRANLFALRIFMKSSVVLIIIVLIKFKEKPTINTCRN